MFKYYVDIFLATIKVSKKNPLMNFSLKDPDR